MSRALVRLAERIALPIHRCADEALGLTELRRRLIAERKAKTAAHKRHRSRVQVALTAKSVDWWARVLKVTRSAVRRWVSGAGEPSQRQERIVFAVAIFGARA